MAQDPNEGAPATAEVVRSSEPLSAKVSPRHREGAWGALSGDERARVQGFIDGSPDRAGAEADFVHLGWRLFLLRELQTNPEGLDGVALEEKRRRLSERVDEALAAMSPGTRASLMGILGDSLSRAGYGPAAPTRHDPQPSAAPARSAAPPPASYREAALKAQAALRQSDWNAAEGAALAAQTLAPQELWAYAVRAMALSMLGRDEEALNDIQTAVRMKPSAPGLNSAYAMALNRALRFQDAERSIDASIAGRPENAWAWYQLAYAQAGLGDREASLRCLEQAARMDPKGFGERRSRALAAAGSRELLALFQADPALDASSFWRDEPGAAARRKLLLEVYGGSAALVVLILLVLLRRSVAAWLIALVAPLPGADGRSVPTVPSGYRQLRQIGTGGMGAVYEAEDLALERRVAIKRMRDEIRLDPRERENFLKEARTVAQLRHPNIVEIHAIVEVAGEVYLVFEFLDGKTLDMVIHENGRLGVAEARGALAQICAALDYAHARGVIHRDLKPANIMLTGELRLKVMDFGVARQARDALSRLSISEAAAGTPPYMSPESETGVVRTESDLYSLGICLYEMLTGARPFDGTNAGMLFSKLNMRFVPASVKAPDLPPALDGFFAAALHCDPERRPRTAAAFLAAFESAAGEAPARPA
jgi:tetratricopeptide (TPR) repeat protein